MSINILGGSQNPKTQFVIADTTNLEYTYDEILAYSAAGHSQKWNNTEFPMTELAIGCSILIPLIVKEDKRRVAILGNVTALTPTSCEVVANMLIEDSRFITSQLGNVNTKLATLTDLGGV